MVDKWNPGATGVLGPEFFPTQAPTFQIASNTDAVAIALQQTTAQAISAAQFHVLQIPQRGGLYPVEVYPNESAVAGAVTTQVAYPNEDVSGGGVYTSGLWQTQSGATTTIYTAIDEPALNTADYILSLGQPNTVVYRFRLSTLTLALAGQRVLMVRLVVWANAYAAGTMTGGLTIGGVDYPAFTQAVGYTTQAFTHDFLLNPATNKAWTVAEVQALDGGANGGYLQVTSNSIAYPLVYAANLPVFTTPETRLAVGVLDDTASGLTPGALNSVPLLTPSGGVWTKAGSGYHTYMLRRSSSVGQLVLGSLDSGKVLPNCRSYFPTIDPTYGLATSMGAQSSKVFCIGQRTTAPADSIDSQPYWPGDYYGYVFTGYNAEMEFSGAAATTYGVVQALVRPGLTGTATADLNIKLKRRADNVQLGGTIVVTRAQVNAAPNLGNGWKLLTVRHTPVATLAAGVQYFREFSSTAVDVGHAWNVAAFYALSFQSAGFGGTTDRATFGGVEYSEYDAMGTIHTSALDPVAPAGVTATVVNVTIPETVLGVTHLQAVDVVWTPTALGGASFSNYEGQRSIDGQATWEPLFVIRDELVNTFRDFESPRGVQAFYRIRTWNSESVPSDWST